MKKIFAIMALTAILVLSIVGIVHAVSVDDSSKTFSIDLAKEWTKVEGENLIDLQGPKEIAQLNVSSDTAEGVTLDIFAKAYPDVMKEQVEDFKLISFKKTVVGSSTAGVWVYTMKAEGITLQCKNVVVFIKDTMYIVTFVTLPERYNDDVSGCDEMMASWKWL